MKPSKEIVSELEAIAPILSRMERVHPYSVPAGYFDAFHEKMMTLIQAEGVHESSAVLARLKQLQPTGVQQPLPTGYFDSFAETMLRKVRTNDAAEELRAISPVLASLPKVNLHSVPLGYFEKLPQTVIQNIPVRNTQSSSVWTQINEVIEGWLSAIFNPRYTLAYASCFTVLTVGMMFFFKPQPAPVCEQLACLTTAEIEQYVSQNLDEFELEAAAANSKASFAAGSGLNAADLDQFLMDETDISDFEFAFENS